MDEPTREPQSLAVVQESAPEVLVLEAPVCRALVMEDRAQVTRKGELKLAAGRQRVMVQEVTPLVVDRSLRVRVRALAGDGAKEVADPPRVLDAAVRRSYVVRSARPEREREIREAVEALVEQYLRVHGELETLHHERSLVERALLALRQQILDRLVVGPFEPGWGEEVDLAFDRRAELEQRILAEQRAQDERRMRLKNLLAELRLALAPVPEYTASIVVELKVPDRGEHALELQYQVPCALWRPSYSAELQQDKGAWRVAWRSEGTVWQLSGEDWKGVELAFSTARPALGAELPYLEDDILQMRPKTEREREMVEVTSRDQAIAKTTDLQQEEQADTPPGLDDGGESRTFSVPRRMDVPSDGRPHCIEFDCWEAPAECELVCMPERAGFVFLRSEQKNLSSGVLLAGPVRLIKEGGYVGRGQIRYVAQGQRFELSWGSEDGLVVLRDLQTDLDETLIRKRRLHDHMIEVYLANHTGEPRSLRLAERVPVSEMDKVEVEIEKKETTPGFERDDQGLLSWRLDLGPGEEKKVRLAFRVSMPQSVIWR